MANLNKVLLIGRLTRDPESRSLSSGSTVVSFGLAVNRTYTRRDSGEKVEDTCFVDVEAWNRTGETIARYMKKGRQIFIEGRLKFDSWEREGQRRSKLSVVADTFQFIDSNGGGGGGDGDSGRSSGESSRGQRAPVGARETPQDDYADADDIPF
jgi:single-strand DNA-binding protein